LLRVDHFLVDVSLGRLTASLGSMIEVESLEIHGVEVNFEKPLGSSSNVQVVREHLACHKHRAGHAAAAAGARPARREAAPALRGRSRKVVIRRLSIKDFRAAVTVAGQQLSARLADLEFKDFSAQLTGPGAHHGAAVVEEVVAELLRTILHAAMTDAHVLLQEAVALERGTVAAVEETARAVREGAGACGEGCLKAFR